MSTADRVRTASELGASPARDGQHGTSLRTLLCVRSIDAEILGPESLTLALAKELTSRGVRFIVVSLWDGTPPILALHEEASRRGLESHVLEQRWGTDPAIIPRLRDMIGRFKADVVITHDPKSEIACLLATRFTDTALIAMFHGRMAIRSRWIRAQEMTSLFTLRLFDHVLTISEANRQELLRFGFAPGRVEALRSFVDTDAFRPPSTADTLAARQALGIPAGGPVLATVARLSAQKGHTYMFRALVDIRKAFPDVLYLVVGPGESWHGEGNSRSDLEQEVKDLGLADAVQFLGYRSDALTIFHAADIIVSPSLREGMSVTLIEALAAGRPIVATSIAGTIESVEHGRSGLLVPPADSGALAAAVCELLGDPVKMRRLGEAARREAEARFDARLIADQVADVCEQAMARR